jgi:hypothetical protein
MTKGRACVLQSHRACLAANRLFHKVIHMLLFASASTSTPTDRGLVGHLPIG